MTQVLEVKSSIEHLVDRHELTLEDDQKTTLHVARFPLDEVQPKVVLFDEETNLLDWCEKEKVDHAIVGGFFLREVSRPLGELWINGARLETVPFSEPWHKIRGSVQFNGSTKIAPRDLLPEVPEGDLLQAGPILVLEGKPVISDGQDPEGFSAGAHQFDEDITAKRHPRAAIGIDEKHIWGVACDGRSETEAGLTLGEFAKELAGLGIKDALNLDGGSSATLIADRQLLNNPRTLDMIFPRGRAIYSAIVLTPSS